MAALTPAVPFQFALKVIASIDDLRRIEPEWAALWERDPHATPFQSPDWLLPWTTHVWGGGQLRVLEIREGSELRAVAPFFLWGYGSSPERVTLSFLGSGITDYLGITCDPKLSAEAGRTILRWIVSNPEWHTCDLQDLRANSPLLASVEVESLGFRRVSCSICPVLKLSAGFDEQLATLPAKFRRNLKVAEKHLHSAGTAEFITADRSNCLDLLREVIRLHNARWRERHSSGMFAADKLRRFHSEVVERFCARGMLRLYGLFLDGACIAAQYNFAAKGREYFYLSGFDARWKRESPGTLLLAHAISRAIADDIREADFLRKAETFKYDWGAKDELTQTVASARGGSCPES